MKHHYNRYLTAMHCALLIGLAPLSLSYASTKNASIEMTGNYTQSSKNLVIKKANTTLYEANAHWTKERFTLEVDTGHNAQLGSIVITSSLVQALDEQGKLLWDNERLNEKVCLPELFGEFIRAHLTELIQGKNLTCVGPIIKAKKLAPFKVYLAKQQNNTLEVKIGPGSIGMWFFMDEVTMLLNADASQVLAYDGVSAAPETLTGDMAYLTISSPLGTPLDIATIESSVLW